MRQAPNFRRRSWRHHQRRHGVEAGKQRRAATMMTIDDDMQTVTLDDIHRRHDGARAAQHGRQCRDLRGVERRAPRSYPIGGRGLRQLRAALKSVKQALCPAGSTQSCQA